MNDGGMHELVRPATLTFDLSSPEPPQSWKKHTTS